MKVIKIKSLTLSNWKGQNRHVEFGNSENKISGANGTGKTSLQKAFFWLLTGYTDANSPKNADLFDNTTEITKDTPIASVKAVITIDNTEYRIERQAQAKFQRRRGTDIWEKASSDTYKFFVDDIELSSTKYDDWVNTNIADGSMLRFAMSGEFFINMVYEDKKQAREILDTITGGVSDTEIKGQYPIITSLKEKYTIDQIEQQATNLIKNVGSELDKLPITISTKEKELSNLEAINFTEIQKTIDEKEKELQKVDIQMFDIAERVKPILQAKVDAERKKQMKQDIYDKAKCMYMQGFIDEDNKLVSSIGAIDAQNQKNKTMQTKLQNDIKNLTTTISSYENSLQRLREKRDTIKAQTKNVCPTCGAVIEGDKLEQQKRKALDDILSEAKEIKNKIEIAKQDIDTTNEKLTNLVFVDKSELVKKLNNLRIEDITPFEETEQGKLLQADIDTVQIPDIEMPDNRDLQDKKNEIQSELRPLYATLGLKERKKTLSNDILDAKTKQRAIGEKLGYYERQRMEVKQYKQERMSILSKKVNALLEHSCVDVWSIQKDGSIVPDLILRDANGVNYSTTNGANRLITVIDIQRFFCKKLDINMPTWVDEASVIQRANLPQLGDVQIFYMFCADNELKVECK